MYCSHGLQSRQRKYAGDLRQRLVNRGFVSSELVRGLADDEILESHRVCSECGAPFYSVEEQNSAILEHDRPADTFAFLGEVQSACAHKE